MEHETAKRFWGDLTPEKRILWFEFLAQRPEGFQRQVKLGRELADFYCEKANLAVLVDGGPERAEELQRIGVSVVTIAGAELRDHFAEVCARIDCRIKSGSLLRSTTR